MHNANGNLQSFDQAAGLVHLATHGAFVRCQVRAVELSTRRTRYPALVTCDVCRSRFSDQERRSTDPNADQDPPGVDQA
jgi:hypothetical protein